MGQEIVKEFENSGNFTLNHRKLAFQRKVSEFYIIASLIYTIDGFQKKHFTAAGQCDL